MTKVDKPFQEFKNNPKAQIPVRLSYFPQLSENWIFSELVRLFCNIVLENDFIAK